MRVHRTISLTLEAAERSEQMDNFSAYICDCLSGSLHIKYEAKERRIKYLVEIIRMAHEEGSQSPKFKKAVAEGVFL